MSLPPCPRDNCTAPGRHYHIISTDGWCHTPAHYSPHVEADTPDPRLHVLERRLPDWAADDLADLLGVGWSVIDGKSGSGAGYSTNSANGRRERLWLSPECITAHQDVLDFTEATA